MIEPGDVFLTTSPGACGAPRAASSHPPSWLNIDDRATGSILVIVAPGIPRILCPRSGGYSVGVHP